MGHLGSKGSSFGRLSQARLEESNAKQAAWRPSVLCGADAHAVHDIRPKNLPNLLESPTVNNLYDPRQTRNCEDYQVEGSTDPQEPGNRPQTRPTRDVRREAGVVRSRSPPINQ